MSKTLTSEEIFKLLTTGEYTGAFVKVACLNGYFGTLYYEEDKETPVDPSDYVGLDYSYQHGLQGKTSLARNNPGSIRNASLLK